ncbi:MAG: inner-rane translocator [Thermomicrobiales bacterium]|nr:inner-rane translocator [Thermomicrobiales bacterium]
MSVANEAYDELGTEVLPARQRYLSQVAKSFTLLILFAIMLVFSLYGGTSFFNARNFNDIIIDSSQLVVLSVGMTFVIIAAGIDLSVGSVLILSSVVAAQVTIALSGTPQEIAKFEFPTQHIGIPIGLVAGVATGLLCGIVNGVLITRLQVPSFIVTLGMLGIALGLGQLLSGGTSVPNVPPAVQTGIGLRELVGFDLAGHRVRITPPVAVAYVIAIIAAIVLNRTRFGRYTYAIGSNAAASRRAGINVDLHLVKVYALSGLLAGVAGAMDLLRFGTASVGSHQADNLAAISATVIGGTSLFGGIGTIGGTVVGAFIPTVLRNGLVIARVQPFWQNVAIGGVLILAVYLDQRRRRTEERT